VKADGPLLFKDELRLVTTFKIFNKFAAAKHPENHIFPLIFSHRLAMTRDFLSKKPKAFIASGYKETDLVYHHLISTIGIYLKK